MIIDFEKHKINKIKSNLTDFDRNYYRPVYLMYRSHFMSGQQFGIIDKDKIPFDLDEWLAYSYFKNMQYFEPNKNDNLEFFK